MRYQTKIAFASLLLVSFNVAKAQSDSIMNKDVEVIKAYQPFINGAIKIGENPKIKDTVNYSPTFDYKISSTIFPVEKTINHLPVVKLGNPPLSKSNIGYAKLGAGNALTPYAELFVNSAVTKKTDFGLQMMHFSSRPNIKLSNELKVKSPFSDNLAKIFMKNYFRKSILYWDIQYNRSAYRYYGFPGTDSTLYLANIDTSLTPFPSKQVINTTAANFNLKNINPKAKLDYDLNLGYSFLWTATGQKEHYGKYNGLYSYNGRKSSIITNTKFEFFYQDSIINNYDNIKNSHQFFHVGLSPQYVYESKFLILKAGINLATIVDDDTSAVFHISPKIDFEYRPIEGILTLFAGTNGGLNTNNYSRTLDENPYINYQTILKPSREVIALYGGFKGMISNKVAYLFDLNYSVRKNEAFYFLTRYDSITGSKVGNLFNVEYGSVNVLRIGGNLRYSSNNINIALSGNYYNRQSKDLAILTHQPKYDAALNTSVQITKKIRGTIDAKVMGTREVKMKKVYSIVSNKYMLVAPVIPPDPIILKTIVDINLGAEYCFDKKLIFFAKATNLLNQNFELWHGYNQPGLMIMAGAGFTF